MYSRLRTILKMHETLEFFASAIPGTEKALCEELRELGFQSVRLNRGGIPFRGTWQEGWRACLQSRIAQRVQVLLRRFPASTPEMLYAETARIDWNRYLSPRNTLSVSCVTRGSSLKHSGFVALKVKDAVVDIIRDRTGRRPSVDKEDPDLKIFVYLANDKVAVYLDLSGEPLHIRGYRLRTGAAPLRETLAAAILRMSGWDRKTQLIDPMCGSGTIAIEAALWASNSAPGLNRERFGFQRWACFTEKHSEELKQIKGELRAAATGQHPRIQAGDIDTEAVENASANAKAAGVRISIKQRSLDNLQANDSRTVMVSNPPYGIRLETDPLFCRNASSVISRLHGWRVCLLAGTGEYQREISAQPVSCSPVNNGDIDCDFLVYEIP